MAKPKATVRAGKDADYTVPGIVAIVAIVILTALFLARGGEANPGVPAGNVGGLAYSDDSLAPERCEQASFCDGTRLVRQTADCSQYEAFCTYGCSYHDGTARCDS